MPARRIPISKVYRAFAELDRFSDETCRAYVRTVMRAHRGSWVLMTLGRFALAFTGFLVLWIAGSAAVMLGLGDRTAHAPAGALLLIGVLAFSVAGPWFISISIRDGWLRRRIGIHIRAAICGGCGYSLLGLPVEADVVQCPECGMQHALQSMGLTPEDILAGAGGSGNERSADESARLSKKGAVGLTNERGLEPRAS